MMAGLHENQTIGKANRGGYEKRIHMQSALKVNEASGPQKPYL